MRLLRLAESLHENRIRLDGRNVAHDFKVRYPSPGGLNIRCQVFELGFLSFSFSALELGQDISREQLQRFADMLVSVPPGLVE